MIHLLHSATLGLIGIACIGNSVACCIITYKLNKLVKILGKEK